MEAQHTGLNALREVESLGELAAALGSAASFLSAAEAVLPPDHEWITRMKDARATLLGQMADPAARSQSGFRRDTQRALADLKEQHVRVYLDLHTRARLGVDDDTRKRRLLNDVRLKKIGALATIDLMSSRQLSDYQDRLAGLKSCFGLTEQDLAAAPACPHCGFRPAAEATPAPVGAVLSKLDEDLDAMLSEWTESLLASLDDPIIREQLTLLDSDQRDFVSEFIASRTLPDDVEHGFIRGVRTLLSGLTKVTIATEDIRQALLSGGSPATIDEMTTRFGDYLTDRAKGKDRDNVRIVLE